MLSIFFTTAFLVYWLTVPSNLLADEATLSANFFKKYNRNNEDIEIIAAFRDCLPKESFPQLIERDYKSKQYQHLNKQWNLRKAIVYPHAYFLPRTARDVANAVKCGIQSDLRVVPNSGGHSYEQISWGNNDTIVVDFRDMKSIRIEGSGKDAVGVFEPGANVAQITAHLWKHGGYAVPMGNCLTVGIGGHAIGGGIGFFSAVYGLVVDQILEMELVDASGHIVVANKNRNPSLFWALRGSGPLNLGIVTRLKLALFDASKVNVTIVRIHYATKHFTESFMNFQGWLKWIAENDPLIYTSFMLASDGYNQTNTPLIPGTLITTVHIQDPRNQLHGNEKFLRAVKEAFPRPGTIVQIANASYIQAVSITSYAPVLLPHPVTGKIVEVVNFDRFNGNPYTMLPKEEKVIEFLKMMRKDDATAYYFKAKSMFVKKYAELEEIQNVSKVLEKIPQNNVWILCTREGGAIQRPAKNATAYVHRDSLLDFTIHYVGPAEITEVKIGMKFVEEFWKAIQFLDAGESYQNYPDLDVNNNLERYFKQNLPRLLREKERWDPDNYFWNPLLL